MGWLGGSWTVAPSRCRPGPGPLVSGFWEEAGGGTAGKIGSIVQLGRSVGSLFLYYLASLYSYRVIKDY